jgi:hypothetical protein
MSPYTMLYLWLGTWHLGASKWWIDLADQAEGDE